MIDFILSKMNLLILVFALFVIVSFFMFGLINVFQSVEATNLLSRMSKDAEALINSPAYCDSTSFFLPDNLKVAGSRFYYSIKISKEETDNASFAIFSILPSVGEQRVVAAQALRTQASVNIFGLSPTGATVEPVEEAVFDPQAVNPINAVVMVKEIRNGKPYLFIVPCSSDALVCELYKTQAGGRLCELNNPPERCNEGFAC